ncbi:MAG: membrane-bound lytic murein transglycosylase MltC [Pseudomonadota bacterium]|uniref:Membrane-bound lytic murein transglycosylase MltC n=1 Tax=Candidatus Desulfatibia profunda TaxID=2841695 RepID=A0A8J6TLZ0_9BACT|nr:membrane-bound lytic murein transglycosylase MltC [Candidatus Desulfatibia profunda]MBL7178700.1 membrane-bound lytic murein transglycosylase MltC [Desulfobacterales bacterium]MBU0698154.1 membrane-bound lytic murein transglycosylase MltC [Pseudomonadota bacterium]
MNKTITTLLIIVLLVACSTGDMVRVARIAATGDIASAQQMAAARAVRYATDPKALQRDILRFEKDFKKLMETFRKAVEVVWGTKEVKEPKPKIYVKYTQNYLSRASVDFDQGVITVETLDQKAPVESLKTAITTTLLTPDDPRAVDLYSAKTITLGEVPFLYGEVKDHEGEDIRWSWRAERFADYLVENTLQTRTIENGGRTQTIHYVTIAMVRDHLQVRAQKYKPVVERFAKEFSVSKNLVYAIMKTESDFNPYAVSNAPAFGLMQIVPATAGQDVSKFLNKSDLPDREFLFNPANNIQYGTAYLHLLNHKYLNDIQNPVSREYCVIAAYNTGAGNVLRTFDRNRDLAPERINRLDPLEVFNTLRRKLPYDEARRYLAKVMDAKKDFVNF